MTPQRRAILAAFTGASTEHLSADEVHARASATVPEISRGTVYAALAELTELGLLAAVGHPEPVRYETNATDHEHFRCRLCLRLYDIDLPAARTNRIKDLGFHVERSTTIIEGICADCVQYDSGLEVGAHDAIAGTGCPHPAAPRGSRQRPRDPDRRRAYSPRRPPASSERSSKTTSTLQHSESWPDGDAADKPPADISPTRRHSSLPTSPTRPPRPRSPSTGTASTT